MKEVSTARITVVYPGTLRVDEGLYLYSRDVQMLFFGLLPIRVHALYERRLPTQTFFPVDELLLETKSLAVCSRTPAFSYFVFCAKVNARRS